MSKDVPLNLDHVSVSLINTRNQSDSLIFQLATLQKTYNIIGIEPVNLSKSPPIWNYPSSIWSIIPPAICRTCCCSKKDWVSCHIHVSNKSLKSLSSSQLNKAIPKLFSSWALSAASQLSSSTAYGQFSDSSLRPMHPFSGPVVGVILAEPWGNRRSCLARHNNGPNYDFSRLRSAHWLAEGALSNCAGLLRVFVVCLYFCNNPSGVF